MEEVERAQERQAEDIALALAHIERPGGASASFCQGCGDEIPEERRQAWPGCTLCVGCKADAERRGG
jgi:phage/conjugal plasmid C-4 type zinc finger TraR family protein